MTALIALAALLGIPSEPYAWRNVEIVGGGFVTGIITHPTAKDLVYARTDIGGAYRWNPGSERWVPLQDWLTRPDWNLYGVESVGLDPCDPNRLYLAAGTYTNQWGGNGAILVSKDRGRSFRRVDLPFKNGGNENGRGMGERLVVDPNAGRIVYFGTRHEGLWRSEDFGGTWARLESFPIRGRTNGIGIAWIVFDSASGSRGRPTPTLYAGTGIPGRPLFVSRDAGATWSEVPGAPERLIPHHAAFDPEGGLWMTFSNGPGPNDVTDGAVLRLDTKSGVWSDRTPLAPKDGDRFGYAGLSIDAANPKRIAVTTLDRWTQHDTMFLTEDGGRSWTSLKETARLDSSRSPFLNWARPQPEFGHWIADVEIDPFNPARAWYVTGATIWRTDNLAADRPTTWTVGAMGLEETAVLDLASPPTGAHVVSALGDIAGFRHDRFDTSPPGGMWTNPLWNTTDDVDYAGLRSNLFIRVGRGGPGQRGAISFDGGATWMPFGSNPPGTNAGGSAAISADGSSIVWAPAGGSARPHVSFDRGTTWRPCRGLPDQGRAVSDKVDPKRFYFYHRQTGDTFYSEDGGATFKPGQAGLPADARRIIPVFNRAGEVWLPAEDGLYRSTDGSRTYRKLPNVESAENVGFGRAKEKDGYPTVYFFGKLAGDTGVYRSTDEGHTWVRINGRDSGFGTMEVIEGDPKVFGRVYLGTNGRGVIVGDPKGSPGSKEK